MAQFPTLPPEDDPSSPHWRPPSIYQWQPGPAGHPAYLPPPVQTPPLPSGPTRRRQEGGLVGGLLAGLAAFFKYGIVLLKVGKFVPTLISMLVAVFFYTIFFGPAFAIGLVLLILIHEIGHIVFAKFEGIPMTMPLFLGPLGAVTGIKAPPRDARQEAVLAIGGPIFGTAAALLCFAWAIAIPPSTFHYLLLALAFFGCFINLFNLIPLSPFDGGRIANAISRWMNVVGIVIMLAVVLFLNNPFAILFLIFGIYTTVQRFRNARRGLEPASVGIGTRAAIGAAWLAMLVIAGGGMSLAHSAIVNSNTVPGVTSSSGSV